MRKWGIIVLILVVALACGVTAASFWDYVVEIVQIAVAYMFDLCKSIVDVLANNIGEVATTTPPTTTQPETARIFVPALFLR